MKATPFIFVCVTLALGIVAASNLLGYLLWIFGSCFILLIAFLFWFRNQRDRTYHFFLFFFLFLQLGFFSVKAKQQEPSNPFPNVPYQVQCEVHEIQKTGSTWNKGIANIQRIFIDSDSTITCDIQLLFYTDKKSSEVLNIGDVILLKSQVQKIRNKGNPGEFDAEQYWKSKSTYYLSFFINSDYININIEEEGFKSTLKTNIVSLLGQYIPQKHIGITKALFLGDKSSLQQEVRNAFSAAGAMHLLAISGLHIGLFIWLIFAITRLFSRFIRRNTALVISLVFIWFYSYLIDFPPSVLRSVLMFSILSLGYFINGNKNQLNILFFSATILLLIHPQYIMDIGFQLSYAAMTGITLGYTFLNERFNFKHVVFKKIWSASALCLSAQLFTFPICIYYFHQFPNYFLITNLSIVTLSGVIVGAGAILIATLKFSFIALKLGALLTFLLNILIGCIEWIEKLPGAVAKGYDLNLYQLLGLLLCAFLVYWNLIRNKRTYLGLAIGLLMLVFLSSMHYNQLNKSHLVLFNTNRFSCALHHRGKTYFIHNDLNPKKYKLLLQDYERCHPGSIKVFAIQEQSFIFKSKNINLTLEHSAEDFTLLINDEEFEISYAQLKPNETGKNKIGMPWVEGTQIRLNKAYFFEF